ncbi:MAG: transposase [Bacteroidota bacterium]
MPEQVVVAPANEHDLSVLQSILPRLHGGPPCGPQGGLLVGDKIYQDGAVQRHLEQEQNLQLVTPVRPGRGRKVTLMEQVLSERVSRLRQPIEALFAWLQHKTGIDQASRVRSTKGLMVHLFGKLAAAFHLLKPNP